MFVDSVLHQVSTIKVYNRYIITIHLIPLRVLSTIDMDFLINKLERKIIISKSTHTHTYTYLILVLI